MPRRVNPKCLACAQLSAAEARRLHGPTGDDCWSELRCPRRRSHYRHRRDNNASRRSQYRLQVGERQAKSSVETLEVELSLPPVAYLYLYREKRQDAPLHAISASVWQGDQKLLEVKPIHCAGLRNQQIQSYLREILAQLKTRFGIRKFEPEIRLDPIACPIPNCALKEAMHD